jgi:hypothetical protein
MELLRTNKLLCDLRKDFSICWDVIKHQVKREQIIDKLGRTRYKPLSGKQKSHIYRGLENQIMKEIYKYLRKHKNKYYNEHDGWRCEKMCDADELINYVRNQTGYMISFDVEIWEYV